MVSQEEKKNKRIAALTTIFINGLVVLLLLFVAAWRAPNPPLPEYGIELNFGMDTQGGGDVQPVEPVGSQESESTEEASAANTEQSEATEATAPSATEVVSKTESPVSVKEVKETPKEVVKEVKEEKKPEPVKTEEKPKEEPKATYKPKEDATSATDKTGKPVSQGDDAGKTGDKGDPKGSIDANALYGKQGGGDGGSSLDLAGWKWDAVPKPAIPDNAQGGKIVFQIKVNEDGEITKIDIIENAVGPEAARICRAEIEKLTFSKTGSNVPTESIGRITFVVRSR